MKQGVFLLFLAASIVAVVISDDPHENPKGHGVCDADTKCWHCHDKNGTPLMPCNCTCADMKCIKKTAGVHQGHPCHHCHPATATTPEECDCECDHEECKAGHPCHHCHGSHCHCGCEHSHP